MLLDGDRTPVCRSGVAGTVQSAGRTQQLRRTRGRPSTDRGAARPVEAGHGAGSGRGRQDPAGHPYRRGVPAELSRRRLVGRARLDHRPVRDPAGTAVRRRRAHRSADGTARTGPGGSLRAADQPVGARPDAGGGRQLRAPDRRGGRHRRGASGPLRPGQRAHHQPGTAQHPRGGARPDTAPRSPRRHRTDRSLRRRAAVRRPGQRGRPWLRPRRRQPAARRADRPSAGRSAARHRAGRRPAPGAAARRDRGPALGPVPAAHRRQPHRASASSHPACRCRVELGPARPGRAAARRAAVRVPGRCHRRVRHRRGRRRRPRRRRRARPAGRAGRQVVAATGRGPDRWRPVPDARDDPRIRHRTAHRTRRNPGPSRRARPLVRRFRAPARRARPRRTNSWRPCSSWTPIGTTC